MNGSEFSPEVSVDSRLPTSAMFLVLIFLREFFAENRLDRSQRELQGLAVHQIWPVHPYAMSEEGIGGNFF